MAYTTQANIETRIGIATLGQLTNDNGGDVPDADVVTAMIAKADAFIDNRLNGIYDVPFTTGSLSSVTTPVLIGQLSTDLASYYCMERRPVGAVNVARTLTAVATLEPWSNAMRAHRWFDAKALATPRRMTMPVPGDSFEIGRASCRERVYI